MKRLLLLTLGLLVVAGCDTLSRVTTSRPTATATLSPTSGSTANGRVTFAENRDGSVHIEVSLTGVPAGVHGFHIHDKGDCGDNGNAAGGHFNPLATPHGSPSASAHHAGDFGNVSADESGNVRMRFNTRSVSLAAGASSAVGHAVILHANPDDLRTQPTGNAGARIACGVVQLK